MEDPKDSDKHNHEVNEPQAQYQTSQSRFFSSFEEKEHYELQQTIQPPPLERIRETVELILRVYGVTRQQLNERSRPDDFKFTRYE